MNWNTLKTWTGAVFRAISQRSTGTIIVRWGVNITQLLIWPDHLDDLWSVYSATNWAADSEFIDYRSRNKTINERIQLPTKNQTSSRRSLEPQNTNNHHRRRRGTRGFLRCSVSTFQLQYVGQTRPNIKELCHNNRDTEIISVKPTVATDTARAYDSSY